MYSQFMLQGQRNI